MLFLGLAHNNSILYENIYEGKDLKLIFCATRGIYKRSLYKDKIIISDNCIRDM